MFSPPVRGLYFPSHEEILDYLQKHPSTRDEPIEVKQIAARHFDHFQIRKSNCEIQTRINEIVAYEIIKSPLKDTNIENTCNKLKTALEDCVKGMP